MSGSSPLPWEPFFLLLSSLRHLVLTSLFLHDKHTDLNPLVFSRTVKSMFIQLYQKPEVTLHVQETVASPRTLETPLAAHPVAVFVGLGMGIF